ncbi:MAG: T9SS type A sorting domain-containing protein [Flavobacteriaceae bacterium]
MKPTLQKYIACLLLTGPLMVWGQTNAWESYYSYNNISVGTVSNQTIVTAAENALLLFDSSQGTAETITTIEGLSGDNISALATYENVILVGHENGLLAQIDINTKKIIFESGITRSNIISAEKKQINHIQLVANSAYVATGFGIVEVNPETLEFGDTYYFGPTSSSIEVNQVFVFENALYAATKQGLFKTPQTNLNKLEFSSWDNLAAGNWAFLWAQDNSLYAVKDEGSSLSFFQLGNTVQKKATFPGVLKNVSPHENGVLITVSNRVYDTDKSFVRTQTIGDLDGVKPNTFNFTISLNDQKWIGTSSEGLIRYANDTDFDLISPQGPLLNSIFDIEHLQDELWIAHGDYNLFYNPYPLEKYGLSSYIDKQWENIPNNQLFNADSFVRTVAHPTEIGTLYACSYHGGIVAIEDNTPVALWDQTNSGLESLTFEGPNYVSIRVRDALVDDNGNLWSITGYVQKGLKKRSPSGQWTGYDLSDAVLDYTQEAGYSNLELYNNKILFFGGVQSGLIGVDISQSPPQMKRIMGGDMGLPSDDIRSIRLDKDNRLWVGTRDGLVILYAPNRFFEEDTQLRSVVISDGGNLRELLSGQFISDIEVDGNNQKWISTTSSGVFLISPDGSQILQHFTKENSPLPTSSVKTIGINEVSGEVYFGTLNGMVSFQGDAYAESESLSEANVFPNPVRPNFLGNVVIRGLQQKTRIKITDIAGNLVYDTTSQGGSISWNLRSFSGARVRSGVYLIFITSTDGLDSAVKKLMVIN